MFESGQGSCDWHLSLVRVSSPWGSSQWEALEGLGKSGERKEIHKDTPQCQGCPEILGEAPWEVRSSFTAHSAHSLQGN